jgi:ParB family chromosome partitioning protein
MSDDGQARRKGLGRGLSALLDEEPDDRSTMERLRGARTVPIEKLSPNRFQPRRYFAEEELQELVSSILTNGILMPILVRRSHGDDDSEYEIVAGERRWRAAQLAQLHEVPVTVKDLDDSQALEMALIENVQRQNLTPLEEADGYRRLMDEFGHTQEAMAEAVGKSRSHVANMLRLLNLPDAVKSLLDEGKLSAGHGRALLAAEDPVALAEKVVARALNVRATENLVKKANEAAQAPARKPVNFAEVSKDANTRALEKSLSERLGLKVSINHTGERGEIRISFRSLEQFDDIIARLEHDPEPS